MNKPIDPHSHWIQSADGLSFRNPAPDASPPMVPSHCVTVQVGATHPQSPASPLPEAAEPVARRALHPSWYAAPSPVAQAPAQAGEVAHLAEAWEQSADDKIATAWGYNTDFDKGVAEGLKTAARDLLAALATPPAQPVLAPVVREPLSIKQILRIADEADLARDYNDDGDVQSTRHEDADITEEVVNFARAIEATHGIQATTGEAT